MFRYTTSTLKKIETLYQEGGYTVRYEKGQFQPGYCILEDKKVIVVNKFFSTESRILTLVDLMEFVWIEADKLSAESGEIYKKAVSKSLEQP